MKLARRNNQRISQRYSPQLQQLAHNFNQLCNEATSIVQQINTDILGNRPFYQPNNRNFGYNSKYNLKLDQKMDFNDIYNKKKDINLNLRPNLDENYANRTSTSTDFNDDADLDELAEELAHLSNNNNIQKIGNNIPVKINKNLDYWVMPDGEKIDPSKVLCPELDNLIEYDSNKYLKEEHSQKNEKIIQGIKELDTRVRDKAKKKYGPYYKRICKRSKNTINLKYKKSSAINNIKKI